MGNNAVKQHFETAKKTGVLKISQQRLNEFPPQLREFPNVLRTLDLSENRFSTLPDTIGQFTLVKHLNVSGNRLTELSSKLGQLVKLETINANNNLLIQLPVTLSNLINLKQIHLSNNQLKTFPIQFCGLKHLDILDLSRNKITEIPSDVQNLQVTELNVNQNQISIIAEELADCPKLKILRIEENCLQITAIHSRIMKESKISNMYTDGNMFQSKQFVDLDGYDEYMERYTAVKKKMF